MALFNLFKRRPEQDELTRKKQIADHGERLFKLTHSPEWAEVVQVRQFMQDTSTLKCRNPNSSDKDRFQASVEWATLEVFFKEIQLRIKRGEEVAKELQELNAKK